MQHEPRPDTDRGGANPALWRNHDFVILLSSQSFSWFGTTMTGVAYPLLALSLTRSPLQAGIVSALNGLPYLILALLAGSLVDRVDRKRLMIVCDAGRTLALASIPIAAITWEPTIVQLYLVALVEGIFAVFFNVAEAAALPRVVARDQLPAASAQQMTWGSLAGLVGPGIGGALFSLARVLPFLGDALTYLASALSLLAIKTHFQAERTRERWEPRREIREGMSWLWNQPVIRFMAFLSFGGVFASSSRALIMIVLAKRVGASPTAVGIVLSAGAVGAVIGSLLSKPIHQRFATGHIIIGLGWATVLVWPLYAVTANPLEIGVVAAAVTFTTPIYNVAAFSFRAALIPDDLQGRVNSVYRFIAYVGAPLGRLAAGWLLQVVGPRSTALLFGVVWLAMAVASTSNAGLRSSSFRSDA